MSLIGFALICLAIGLAIIALVVWAAIKLVAFLEAFMFEAEQGENDDGSEKD